MEFNPFKNKFLFFGHRGTPHFAPENTLISFKKAIDMGVDGIELDVISTMDDEIIIVTTDRVSAFDNVLGTIPFKGQILTEIANFWFEKTKHIAPNHIISCPDSQVLVARKAKPLPVEVIVRGYITGSLWREYEQGINGQYGFLLPEGLKKDQKFNTPILTPSTKAEYGQHDEPISRDEVISKLNRYRIQTRNFFYPMHKQNALKKLNVFNKRRDDSFVIFTVWSRQNNFS